MEIAARVGKSSGCRLLQFDVYQNDLYRDPNLVPDIEALQRSIDVQQESLGFLKNKMDMKKYADLSFVRGGGEAAEIELRRFSRNTAWDAANQFPAIAMG